MILYHFTSVRHLRGIARHGLTVGDVPTDIARGKGRIGVWLTASPQPTGHGLEGSAVDKSAFRLSVDVQDGSPLLVHWLDWARRNVTPDTLDRLHATAARHGGEGPSSWFVFFGILPQAAIVACQRTATGEEVPDWGELISAELSLPAVAPWRRDTWHRALLRRTGKIQRRALRA